MSFVVNSFQVPNALVDCQMAALSGSAFKCLVFIIRQTRGWHKQSDSISVSQFMIRCNLSKNTVLSAIDELKKADLVKQVGGATVTSLNTYSLTSLFDAGEVLDCPASAKTEPVSSSKNEPVPSANFDSASSNFEPPSAKIEPVASAKIEPTKDILFKDTIQKTNTKDSANKPKTFNAKEKLIDDGVDVDVVDDFLKSRKKDLTETAYKLLCKQAGIASLSIADAVEFAAGKQWMTFTAAYYLKEVGAHQANSGFISKQKPQSRAEMMRNVPDLKLDDDYLNQVYLNDNNTIEAQA